MRKPKYVKTVVKTMVNHKTSGVCEWKHRNRPGRPVRKHRSVYNHAGSGILMESTGELMGVKELATQGTPKKCIEGNDDNTLIACIKYELNISLKKSLIRVCSSL